MAKEQDQAQQIEEENAESVEMKEEDTSTDKAVETSKKFDELLDKEGVEETPPDEVEEDSKKSEDKDKSKAEDKDTGDEDEDKDSDKDDDKDADKTGDDEPKVSDELAKRAIDLGLTEEEIADFESDEELEKTLNIIESVVKEEDAADQSDSAQSTDKKKTKDDEEDTGIKFENEDEIDPEILKGIRSLEQQNKDLRKEVDELKTGVQQEQQRRQAESQRQFVKRFDGMVDKLGLDFVDVFGKGSLNDLSKRSKAYKNRDTVRGRMYALGVGFQTAEQPIPDEQQLFDLAINSLYGDKVKTSQGLRVKKAGTKYKKGAQVGRSATKKTGKLTGEQKAIATSKKFDEKIDELED
jgi:hypothetical protein